MATISTVPKQQENDAQVAHDRHIWFLLSFLGLIIIVIVGLFYFVYRQQSDYFARFFVWYASLVTIVAIAAAKYKQCCRLLSSTSEEISKAIEHHEEEILKKLKTEVFPRVTLCDTRDDVYEMAAWLIREAHHQKQPELRYVTFYGAASLAIPEIDYDEFGGAVGLGQQTPYQHYVGAIEAATGEKIRIRRYIRMFEPDEFKSRSVPVQREYISWLKSQHDMLSRNPNYLLANVVRAPHWGANLARLITHTSMMEITGDGAGAVVISDQYLCDTVRQYARQAILGGKQPEYFGQGRECGKDNLHEFWQKLRDLERLIATSSASDEESVD